MSVPGLLIDPEVVRECGPAVVLWSPACRQPVGPASGASQWGQPRGLSLGFEFRGQQRTVGCRRFLIWILGFRGAGGC